jgi:Fe2+ transport system protein FeoA
MSQNDEQGLSELALAGDHFFPRCEGVDVASAVTPAWTADEGRPDRGGPWFEAHDCCWRIATHELPASKRTNGRSASSTSAPGLPTVAGVPSVVLALAEDLNTHIPVSPGDSRIITSRYSVVISADPDPHRNVVQRLRLTSGEIESTVAEVRAHLAARGRYCATWEVGSSAVPPELAERLMALGMVPDEPEPFAVGMVLTRPLGAHPTAAVVRRVTTLEDYRIADSIYRHCFGGEEVPPCITERRFVEHQAVGIVARYLASIDGEPVAAAEAMYLEDAVVLCGGASLPTARGRGAYRALVRARWEEGARRGTPILVTQANAMSRPILRRLGFQEVAMIRIFRDQFGD